MGQGRDLRRLDAGVHGAPITGRNARECIRGASQVRLSNMLLDIDLPKRQAAGFAGGRYASTRITTPDVSERYAAPFLATKLPGAPGVPALDISQPA